MKTFSILFLLVSMCVSSFAAAVFPASTNGANVFTATNTFATWVQGNGGGLTNLSRNGLDNISYTWFQKSSFDYYPSNLNRRVTQRIADLISSNKVVSVMDFGNGLVGGAVPPPGSPVGMFDALWTNIFKARPKMGRWVDWSGLYFPVRYNARSLHTNTISWWNYDSLEGANGAVLYNFGAPASPDNPAANILRIIYTATNNAATFDVWTNDWKLGTPGPTNIAASIDPTVGYGARILEITNSFPIKWQVAISNTAAGTNNILSVGMGNTMNAYGGLIYNHIYLPSSPSYELARVPADFSGPTWASWGSDLILMNVLTTYDTNRTHMATVLATLATYATNSVIVYVAENPDIEPTLRDMQAASQYVIWTNCMANGWGYLDLFNMIGDFTNNWRGRGFQLFDSIHPSAAGNLFISDLTGAWLQLNNGKRQ